MGLLCIRPGLEGGGSSWCSSIAVHNEMIKMGREDLVKVCLYVSMYVCMYR